MAAVWEVPIRVAPAATIARASSVVWIPPAAFTPAGRRGQPGHVVVGSLGFQQRVVDYAS
jgi:hypothetical protein